MKTRRSDFLFIISGGPWDGGMTYGASGHTTSHLVLQGGSAGPGWPVGTEVLNKQESAHFGGVEQVMRMVPAT